MRMSPCSCKVSTLSNGELLCWPAEGHDPSHQGHPVAQDKLLQGAWHPFKSLLITQHPNKSMLQPMEPPRPCFPRPHAVLYKRNRAAFDTFLIRYHHKALSCSTDHCPDHLLDWSESIDLFSVYYLQL